MKRSMHVSPELQRFVGKTVPKDLDRSLKQASYLANRRVVEEGMATRWREFQELLFATECPCVFCQAQRAMRGLVRDRVLTDMAQHAKPVGSA